MHFQEGVARYWRQIHPAVSTDGITSPKDVLSIVWTDTQIEIHRRGTVIPVAQQRTPFIIGDVKNERRSAKYTRPDALQQLSRVAIASAPIHDPDHLSIKGLTSRTFFRLQKRVLEFDDHAGFGLHIGDMFIAVRRDVNDLLPAYRKLVFPTPMPFGLRLPPWIADPNASVCPVPDPQVTTFGDDICAARGTCTCEARLGLAFLLIDVGELHSFPDFAYQEPFQQIIQRRCHSKFSGVFGLCPNLTVL